MSAAPLRSFGAFMRLWGSQGALVAGPALGGFICVAGAQAVYAVCAVRFALSGMLLAGVRYAHAPDARNLRLDTRLAGVRFVPHRPAVLGAISLDLLAGLLGGLGTLLVAGLRLKLFPAQLFPALANRDVLTARRG